MPGCLGLDALWQLTGFYLGWLGEPGKGRALSTGEVKFTGQITPETKLVEFGIDFKRVMRAASFSARPTAGSRRTAKRCSRPPTCASACSRKRPPDRPAGSELSRA